MSTRNLIVFPTQDFKYNEWSKAFKEFGIETYADSSPFVIKPITLIILLLKNHNICAYFFRYLNDKPSFVKSLLKAICDALIVMICKLANIKIYWILHNVDKETKSHFPSLTRFRRSLLKKFATKIWVMDKLLINHAISIGFDEKRLDWLCFGRPTLKKVNTETLTLKNQIISFRQRMEETYGHAKVYIGLCVTSPVVKFNHFLQAPLFVDSASSDDALVCLVIYGQIPDHPDFNHLSEIYDKNEKILHINKNHDIDESALSDQTDFIYRSLDDLSVSYSVYVAAAIGKPVISHDVGFLSEMITDYRLGLVVPAKPNARIKSISEFLEQWDRTNADRFLSYHSWYIAADKIQVDLGCQN